MLYAEYKTTHYIYIYMYALLHILMCVICTYKLYIYFFT